MNQKEMEHLTYLTRRYREACFGVQRAMAIAAKCTARLTHAPGGSTGSQVENGVELLMEARRKRDRIRQELESERQKLSVDISKLSSERQQLAATLRWVKGWPMAKIEVEMGCSRQAIYKLLAKAKENLSDNEPF